MTGTCSWCTCWGASTPSSHCPPAPPWQHGCSEICLIICLTYNVKMDTFDINSINLPLLPVKFQWTYKFWIPNFTGPQYLLEANGSKNFFMDVLVLLILFIFMRLQGLLVRAFMSNKGLIKFCCYGYCKGVLKSNVGSKERDKRNVYSCYVFSWRDGWVL